MYFLQNKFRMESHIFPPPLYFLPVYSVPVAVVSLCQNKALDLHYDVNEIMFVICSVQDVEIQEDYAVSCHSVLPKIVFLYVKSFKVTFQLDSVLHTVRKLEFSIFYFSCNIRNNS